MVKLIGCMFLIQNRDIFESCQIFDENVSPKIFQRKYRSTSGHQKSRKEQVSNDEEEKDREKA